MNTSIDKYLTTEPEDQCGQFFEGVCNNLCPAMQKWDDGNGNSASASTEFEMLVDALFMEGIEPKAAADIISKAFALFRQYPAHIPGSENVYPEKPKRMKDFFYLVDPGGPTGHGDICHSDADPGL